MRKVSLSSQENLEGRLLRRNDGARVIQFPSGNMPTISECACCDIMRTSWRR